MKRIPWWAPALGAALALGLLAASTQADVYILRGGDRITGEPVLEGKRSFKVKTPYGVLTIPRTKVDRVIRPDGTEQAVNPAPAASPKPVQTVATLPPGRRARLILIITGKTFWQAWDPKAGDQDPTLRLQVTLDEEVVATYVDAKTDPDIPGAMVNSFSFAPEDVVFVAGRRPSCSRRSSARAASRSRSTCAAREAPRLLRVAYQGMEGTHGGAGLARPGRGLHRVELRPRRRPSSASPRTGARWSSPGSPAAA